MSSNNIGFFDTDGRLWITCSSSEPGAEAFGPSGVARRAARGELGLTWSEEETAWVSAKRQGWLIPGDEGEWETLNQEKSWKWQNYFTEDCWCSGSFPSKF